MKILTPELADLISQLGVERLAGYLKDNNIHTTVLGISGGLDSAVMAVTALGAIERLKSEDYEVKYRFVFIDCESNPDDLKKARLLAKEFSFKLFEFDITDWYLSCPLVFFDTLVDHVRMGNVKCRLRMIVLYDLAKKFGGIVLDTDDYSELWMGFWTRHGDEGDVKLIQELTKQELFDLAERMGIPKEILDAPPGDGLRVTPTSAAQEQLGLPYLLTDYIISALMFTGFDPDGDTKQLESEANQAMISMVASTLDVSTERVTKVLRQALKTGYKRRFGENVALLMHRAEMGLPQIGTREFNELYLRAIKAE